MLCPRCGEPLSNYRLGDIETMACNDCSYVGVPAAHEDPSSRHESWDDALDRFYDDHRLPREHVTNTAIREEDPQVEALLATEPTDSSGTRRQVRSQRDKRGARSDGRETARGHDGFGTKRNKRRVGHSHHDRRQKR